MDMVDTVLEHDKTGVKTAINHILCSGGSYNPEQMSSLHLAIQKRNSILVLKLLEAGASPHIDFETWLKSAKISPLISNRLGDLEQNKATFNKMEQPLVTAVRWGEVAVALKLLEDGADPNYLTPRSHSLFADKYTRRYTKGMSVLDLVQSSIKQIKRHISAKKSPPGKPEMSPGLDEYPANFTPGTYRHAVVSRAVKDLQSAFEDQMKRYQKGLERKVDSDGEDEKRRMLGELLSEFEALQTELLSRGAKTFKELHPEIQPPEGRHGSYSSPSEGTQNKEPLKPYEYVFNFRGDKDLTEKRRDGYIELYVVFFSSSFRILTNHSTRFDAAWAGNVDRIKELTLQAWGAEKDQPPLKMAISDSQFHSPFSIAFLRGHHDVAKVILEIVKAQWTPKEEDKVRYKLGVIEIDDEDSDQDSYLSDVDDREPQMVSEKVDRKFTIDNIGQVSMQVESHVKPLEVINDDWRAFVPEGDGIKLTGVKSLFKHCFEFDDSTSLNLLLDMAQYWARQKLGGEGENEEESSKIFTLSQQDFQWAIDYASTKLLGIIIKRTGAGIPLDHLVKKSGVEIKQKPRYYQGLTVYGKKR